MDKIPAWQRKPPGAFDFFHSGPSVLLARLCDDLNVASIINSMVTWDSTRWNVSPGKLAVALILNVLIDRKPLYQVEEFYQDRDLELLFGEKIEADAFNDDALGRMLDRISATDMSRLVQSVALCAVHTEGLDVRTVHADTTSVSVYGEYAVKTHGDDDEDDDKLNIVGMMNGESEPKKLVINRGYSKDKRPDLKQYTAGLVVSHHGIPMMGTIGYGNLNDNVWNLEILESIRESFLDPKRIIYVAGSALVTKKNLKHLEADGVRFISRVPANFKVESIVKAKLFPKKNGGRWGPWRKQHLKPRRTKSPLSAKRLMRRRIVSLSFDHPLWIGARKRN